ncbi:MAG: inorganic diphosphatase, partial [Pseudomonadota bacterium]
AICAINDVGKSRTESTVEYRSVSLSPSLIAQIAHFFEHYKDLEPGKWVKTEGWVGVNEAHAEVLAGIERYQIQKGDNVDQLPQAS